MATKQNTKPAARAAVKVTETPDGDVVAEVTAPAPATCRCGCGAQVASRRLYRPGHDARHAGVAARAALAGDPTAVAALPTPALQAKAQGLADRWRAAAQEKAARAQARADEAAAKAKALQG